MKDCFFKKGTALCKCAFKDGEIDIKLYTSQKNQLKHLGWILHPNGDDTEFSFCRLSLCNKCDKISCESLYSGTELSNDFATGVYCKLYQSAVQHKPEITRSEEIFLEAFTNVFLDRKKPNGYICQGGKRTF